jgi:hypothetical protein
MRWISINHLKKQDSERPNIGFQRVNILDIALRTHVERTSDTACVFDFYLTAIKKKILDWNDCSKTEITDLACL